MSEAQEPVQSAASSKTALLQRLRLPLMIGGAIVALLVFLLIGFGLGKGKQALERKQVAEQMLQFKNRIAAIENAKKLSETKAEDQAQVIDKQKLQIEELESKLEAEKVALAQKASELASIQLVMASKTAAPAKAAASAPKPREYARFGNEECTLLAGKGSEGWKECLQGRIKVPGATAAARVAKNDDKPEMTAPKAAMPPQGHSGH